MEEGSYRPFWLTSAALGQDGRLASIEYKAYVYPPQEVLWSLPQVLEALMANRDGRIDTCREIRKQGDEWQVWLLAMGVDGVGALQRSLRSALSTGAEISSQTREEDTIRTLPLLVLHIFWAAYRRGARHRARAMLESWFARLLPGALQGPFGYVRAGLP